MNNRISLKASGTAVIDTEDQRVVERILEVTSEDPAIGAKLEFDTTFMIESWLNTIALCTASMCFAAENNGIAKAMDMLNRFTEVVKVAIEAGDTNKVAYVDNNKN